MVGHFRRILVEYGGLQPASVTAFTLQSCKVTLLAWCVQLGLPEPDRAAQGHHRSPTVSGCVRKYGRNDVIPALRCQHAVLVAAATGWIPRNSGRRGAEPEVAEEVPRTARVHPEPLTGAPTVETLISASRASVDLQESGGDDAAVSDEESEVSEAEEPRHGKVAERSARRTGHDTWILNSISGFFHTAVWSENS